MRILYMEVPADGYFLFAVKKQNTKNLKILVRLYSSFSSEVVATLLELLLKAVNSSNLVEVPEDFQVVPIIHNLLDGWKLVITKLSNKEPELLMALLTAVLDRIETQEAIKYETGNCQFNLRLTTFRVVFFGPCADISLKSFM